MTQKIEFTDLKAQYQTLKSNVDARIQTVLDHGQYIMGPEVKELEQQLQTYTGAKHCITVASGTEALLIALMALNIGPGDEVITTPFTFVATAEVIALVGATPVFVDIDPDTCNIEPKLIEAAITEKTKAIMPVSLYGQVADMDEINALAMRNGNIPVIEDAAQSFGALYKGKRSCNLSSIGCTSFFPSKPLGCYGDGGAIFTNDDVVALAMREIRVHGQARRYYHTRIGVGGRMDTIQCAIILAKLDVFDHELQLRSEAGQRYIDLLRDIPGIAPPVVAVDRNSVWGQFTIQVDNRDKIAEHLKQVGIPTAVHYPVPLDQQPAYKNLYRANGLLDKSASAAKRVLSLPMHPYLDLPTQSTIVEALKKAIAA